MKHKAQEFLKHPLIYGSSIVVIGGLVANFINFLFNLFMSRNLIVSDYGTLASIVSLIGFPTLILTALTPLVVSFAGEYFVKGQLAQIRGLYLKVLKFLFALGILVFLSFIFFLPSISSFFHINNRLILLLADFMIFLAFMGILNLALLQAKLAFGYQLFLSLLGAVVKLILGILLVFAGFSVTGAVWAMAISGFVLYIFSFYPIKFIFDKKLISDSIINTKELFKYGVPSALTLLGLTSFISSDVVLVKHFFNPHTAGIYAGLSLLGKVIFYITAPIMGVMFPLIVQKHGKNENFNNTFILSLLLVLIPSIMITAVYFLFPSFSILFFLKKSEYLIMVPYLGFFGIFMSLYCLLHITASFYLSIKKTSVYIPIILGAVMQIILITFYHQTFNEIIVISIIITFLLVLGLLLYYPHAAKKRF